ncbi:MAG TPA: hypothetical protein VJ775_06055 [Sphingomicrobium sp.]|nr:hypothetical protein [Sphingomicrobium sp.]
MARADFAEADVGQRVVYDPAVKGMSKSHGVVTAVEPNGDAWVLFDFADGPLRVFSNLTRAAQSDVRGDHG